MVVDPGALGGTIATVCDPGSGEVAATRFEQSGFVLTEVQRFPGFVCRVNGAPASDPCVNTPPPDAYWSLWWTDGTSGAWNYSSEAVTSLDVPDGGAVALAWQQGAARRTPGVDAPVQAAPSPTTSEKPTPSPTTKPTPRPTRTPTPTPVPSASSSAETAPAPTTTPSASAPSQSPSDPTETPTESPTEQTSEPAPSPSVTETPSPSETSEATATPTDGAVPPEARTEEGSSRVPTWLTLAIIAMLLLAIGMSAYAARRRTRG